MYRKAIKQKIISRTKKRKEKLYMLVSAGRVELIGKTN